MARDSLTVRTLSGMEQSFLDELRWYDKVIQATMSVSLNQHGIDTDGRGLRASRIFTRQTLTGLSLHKILPRPSPAEHKDSVLWDIGSIASLTRSIVEGYLSFYYFGIEPVSASEADLRFFILQLHRNVEWYDICKSTNPHDQGLKEFEAGIPSQRERIRSHPYLESLTETQRTRALRGLEMYKTKVDFETELEVCKGLRRDYRYLSNLVHPLPMSIERIDNEKGRGIGSDADINHCLLCVILSYRYLAATTVGMVDHFSEALSNFHGIISEIRPLIHAESDGD